MIIRKGEPAVDQDTDERVERLRFSDAGGLTQFGAYLETLQPGSRSSDRH